jgi:hypothetical protein
MATGQMGCQGEPADFTHNGSFRAGASQRRRSSATCRWPRHGDQSEARLADSWFAV